MAFFHSCRFWHAGYNLQVQIFDAGNSGMCSHDCGLFHLKSSKYHSTNNQHGSLNCWFYDIYIIIYYSHNTRVLENHAKFPYFPPGQWKSLALGRLHSPSLQCLSHRNLQHVEPVCFHHYLPLCPLPQARKKVKRMSTYRSVTFQLYS